MNEDYTTTYLHGQKGLEIKKLHDFGKFWLANYVFKWFHLKIKHIYKKPCRVFLKMSSLVLPN